MVGAIVPAGGMGRIVFRAGHYFGNTGHSTTRPERKLHYSR